ncbi:WW domain-binding protein 11-like [Suncus etruscus]|uniref:WW domain-binding protein 11-like n=1 Tax=Suncus etruscus TaxID=109475 RepID=UPI00210FB4B7|nr:WW domain-binding protein 11-like [Suncus etruscus]
MGQRSTSSTKSGKFMNPTDQARKAARKRELKKNKKQRMMVRAAVLKMKDPKQIIRDMKKLDEMEFNPVQQPQLNEKVLKDKRKKLRETFERILRLYEKENPDIYKELRKLEVECEQKRAQLSQYFDAVKNAQHVEVESIPLPDMPHAPSNILIQDIPLPGAQPPSILKKTSAYGLPSRAVSILPLLGLGVPRLPPGRKPPGPPPGPPPPQVLQMYGRKVGFALALSPRRRDEDMLYSPPPRGPPARLPPPAPPAPLPNPGVLSAPPKLIQLPKANDRSAATIEKKATATISAKPQITNLKAEITRFVPTALRMQF